jgi:predicted DNA-binding transcriptional regulator YafY
VLAFEPDELEAIARAAHRVSKLGDPALAHEALTALRKLAHDMPVLAQPVTHDAERVVTEPAPDAALLDALGNALHRRKSVAFTYRSMHRDETASRTVDPWGLAFLSGHWYLVGRDHAADALRQFRVSRISDPKVNEAKAQSHDFVIPADFDLALHVRSRQAWELGDAEVREVLVRFLTSTGVTNAAMQLGEPVDGETVLRRFRVRRPDTFALWILGFAGDARVEQPAELASQVRALATAALRHYEAAR